MLAIWLISVAQNLLSFNNIQLGNPAKDQTVLDFRNVPKTIRPNYVPSLLPSSSSSVPPKSEDFFFY